MEKMPISFRSNFSFWRHQRLKVSLFELGHIYATLTVNENTDTTTAVVILKRELSGFENISKYRAYDV
jgi:hypothetical protein